MTILHTGFGQLKVDYFSIVITQITSAMAFVTCPIPLEIKFEFLEVE